MYFFFSFFYSTELGLIKIPNGAGPVYIYTESNTVYGASGRPTVAIGTNKVYTGGLIIGDFAVGIEK